MGATSTPPKTSNGAPRIYRDVVQGTEEWKRLRLGIPTSSQFHRIVTPTFTLPVQVVEPESVPMFSEAEEAALTASMGRV